MNVKNADDVPISNSKREAVKLDIKKAKTPYSSTPRPRASIIRLKWSEYETHPFIGNDIPEWLRKELGNSYFKRAYMIGKAMSQRLAILAS